MEQPLGRELTGHRRRARAILAAGDDRAALGELAQSLGRLGYLVVLGDSSRQALELISARGFDLVLLDVAPGSASGMHVLGEIRGARDTADLAAILLVEDPAEQVRAFAAGADDCVARPFPFELLAARIERTLARAARVDELKRCNLALDARIAARAMELGEVRAELAAAKADRARLIGSIQSLHAALDGAQNAA